MLDSFFGNVCELDLVFNFYKVGCVLDFELWEGCGLEEGRRERGGDGEKERSEGGKGHG